MLSWKPNYAVGKNKTFVYLLLIDSDTDTLYGIANFY